MNVSAWYRHWATLGPRHVGEWLVYYLLLPLAVIYTKIGKLRARFYRQGILPSRRVAVPVISVGNLVAGGTGKTPMIGWLLQWALQQGIRVAVVSRGYGGERSDDILTVCNGSGPLVSAVEAGDEPWLLASRYPEIIVVVGKDRVGAAACAVDEHAAELLLLDDGYQHLRLQRDLNLLLFDARAPYGNGQVLPAGYLREPISARERADLEIFTHWSPGLVPDGSMSVCTRHVLADHAIDLHREVVDAERLQGRAAAFCGIADPEGFFDQLRGQGYNLVETLALPDHCRYSAADLARLEHLGKSAEFFLTTEKDGVKLTSCNLARPCYQIPLEFEFVSGQDRLIDMLHALLNKDHIMPLSQEFLDILACPQCKGPVELDQDESWLLCPTCALQYPIRDEIPMMLLDEAIAVSGEPATGE